MPAPQSDRIRRANIVALAILALGSLQMAGHIVGSSTLRGVAAATATSPLPKVFGEMNGLETFASEVTISYWEPNGTEHSLPITPELYARIGGPYDRRSAYATALSEAPRLPEPLWSAVVCYGLSQQGPLRREIGLRPDQRDIAFTIRTRTRGRHDSWTFAPSCTR